MSAGFQAKTLAHNAGWQPGPHKPRLFNGEKELACGNCDAWAPIRYFSAFTQECCGTVEQRAAAVPPVGADAKKRKAWRERATQLRHARHAAGK